MNKVARWFKTFSPRSNFNVNNYFGAFVVNSFKCGSSTLTRSLSAYTPTLHIHHTEHLNTVIKNNDTKIKKDINFSLSDYINFSRKQNKIFLFNSVREPLSRIMSGFFEGISKKRLLIPDHNPIENLIEIFKKEYLFEFHKNLTHNLKDFGTDLFQTPFNKNSGFKVIYSNDKVVFDLVFENIDQWENILRQETPFRNLKLLNHNLSSNKWINPLYKKFLNTITFTKAEIETLYHLPIWNKILSHYYTNKQIDKFIMKHISKSKYKPMYAKAVAKVRNTRRNTPLQRKTRS